MSDAIWPLSAHELSALLAVGSLRPDHLLEVFIERIERIDPVVNAFCHLSLDSARQAAQASLARQRAGRRLGPLDGLPVSVKDNLFVADMPTTWGSRLYADHVPIHDDLAIERLRRAGAVVLGKTNTPEFALAGRTDNLLFGVTRNPWNPALNPGGSSGGAVAALAAGLCPLALGTDAGGSGRLPASFTGVVGMRPSTGRVARCHGFPSTALDFQVITPMARTVADLRMIYEAVSGPDSRDPSSLHLPSPGGSEPGRPLRVRLALDAGAPVDPQVRERTRRTADLLRTLGHAVNAGPVPYDLDGVRAVWRTVTAASVARVLARHPDGADRVGSGIAELDEHGRSLTATDLMVALDRIASLRREVSIAWADFDVLLTPTAAAPAWPIERAFPERVDGVPGDIRSAAVFTTWVNLCGLPAISVPVAPAEDGRPIGIQLVGAFGADGVLLDLAETIEAAWPWADRWPELAKGPGPVENPAPG